MITSIKKHPYVVLLIVMLLVFVSLVIKDTIGLRTQQIYSDEFVFLKVSKELPKYDTSLDWLNGYKEFDVTFQIDSKILDNAYDNKVWLNPPIANICMFPFVWWLSDDQIINDIWYIRIIYAVLLVVSVGLLVDVIRRKFNLLVTSLSLITVIINQNLITSGIYCYHDGWMVFFLILTLWLMEVKPDSKWKYITAFALVGCKLYAVIFVIPIAILEYRKNGIKSASWISSSVIILLLFVLYQYIITGDLLYIYNKYSFLNTNLNLTFMKDVVLSNVVYYIFIWNLYIYVPLIVGGIICWIKGYRNISIEYLIIYGITVVVAITSGLIGNKTYPIIILSIPVVIPLIQRLTDSKRIKQEVLVAI